MDYIDVKMNAVITLKLIETTGATQKRGRVSHVAVDSGLQTELLDDSDERYSVVTNLDEKLDLPEVFRDRYDEVEPKDMEQIYEGCPESEGPFYEELLGMFSYSLTNDNTKIRVHIIC